MAAKVDFPFTYSQWKELERQAMIFKYMVASIPVPPDLLFPLIRNFPSDSSTNIWRYSNSKDSEPGRCKRTDGKKWRCAKDVAPNQKYCERHMHRGRPRSRKPVELHATLTTTTNAAASTTTTTTTKKTRLNSSPPCTAAPTVVADPNSSSSHQMLRRNLVFPETNTDLSIRAFTNRDVDWVMEDKMVGIDGVQVQQQWFHLMDTKIGLASENGSIYDHNTSLFDQDYKSDHHQHLNLFPYTNLAASGDVHRSDECQFFFNTDLVSEQPKGFIDAWSNDTNNKSTLPISRGNLSPSSLTLSMAGNTMDEENGPCWVPFARGGPLAEVLHTGSVTTPSNPASSYTGYGDSISSTVSSPSEVLQRAFFSQSDSSVCNSPIVSAQMQANEGVVFQWLN